MGAYVSVPSVAAVANRAFHCDTYMRPQMNKINSFCAPRCYRVLFRECFHVSSKAEKNSSGLTRIWFRQE